MERRQFITAVGAAAAVLSTSAVLTRTASAATELDPPQFAKLEATCSASVLASGDCLRLCFFMFADGDTSMAVCARKSYELGGCCSALERLSSDNSPFTLELAKVVRDVCADCLQEAQKFLDFTEIKAMADSCKACIKEIDALLA